MAPQPKNPPKWSIATINDAKKTFFFFQPPQKKLMEVLGRYSYTNVTVLESLKVLPLFFFTFCIINSKETYLIYIH